MRAEFDLPSRFLAVHRPTIESWLETAIPGQTLCIAILPEILLQPFVSTTALESRTAVLSLVKDGRDLVVKPSDRHSARIIEREEARLRGLERPAPRMAVAERTACVGHTKPSETVDALPSWATFPRAA